MTAALSPGKSGVVTLVVDGAVPGDMPAQCAALGLRIGSPGDDEGIGSRLLVGAADPALVRRGLAAPFSGFIELGDEGVLGVGLRCFEAVRSGGYALSLLTGPAYGLNTTELVGAAIRRGMDIPDGKVADLIDICMGEAISNAIIHGNLGIPSHLRTTTEGFAQFQRLLHKRMADPVVAARRLEINVLPQGPEFVTVSVSDQGAGFDLAKKLEHTAAATAKNGRGLSLIRKAAQSVHGEDGGRTLVMTFAR